MAKFIRGSGPWTAYRALPGVLEVDFHDGPRRDKPYWEVLEEFRLRTLNSLRSATAAGQEYVLFTHGASTSGAGRQTARSIVRGIMRSKEATPLIDRARSIQHETVFVAALRRTPKEAPRCD